VIVTVVALHWSWPRWIPVSRPGPQIPYWKGIWGPEFGTKVIVVNTALKIVFISLTVVALLAI
jgi:hypothetical protein